MSQSNSPNKHSRRQFLQQAGAWSTLLAMGDVAAQSATDYKALVCVFLAGGNDTYNMVLATDPSSWAAYTSVRTQAPSPIALMAPGTVPDPGKAVGSPERLGGVLPITPATAQPDRSFALHPRLTELQKLFNIHKRLAVVANVGPLVQPLDKAAYQKGGNAVPRKLYSHNDQQNSWMALAPEGATVGWGGRLVDLYVGKGNAKFPAVSVSGNAVWLSGQKVKQYQMGVNGATAFGGSNIYGSTKVADALKRIASNGLTGPNAAGSNRSGHVFMAELGGVSKRSIEAETLVTQAFDATKPASDTRFGPDTRLQYTNLNGNLASNGLASQLQAVARVIASRSTMGAGRQVFFVQMGGFDTHDNQNVGHGDLMARLDHALGYFNGVLDDLGVANKVTTFTASDFGRTFTSNGDGTDHGWGAHHFVMGGAVKGGDVYGAFPAYSVKNTNNNNFDGSPDQLTNGALLPKISVDQFGATLGRWFAAGNITDAQLKGIFTNLDNFPVKDLGFL